MKIEFEDPNAPANEKFWALELLDDGTLTVAAYDDAKQRSSMIEIRRVGSRLAVPPRSLHLTWKDAAEDEFVGDLMTKQDFILAVRQGVFIDDDGYGHAVKSPCGCHVSDISNESILPSQINLIPEEVTHIAWYNR